MATSLYKAQSALPTCLKHKNEEIDMYCRTCGKRVCEKCAKEEHKDHDWTRAEKEGKHIRRNASSRSTAIRELIDEMKQASKNIQEPPITFQDEVQKVRKMQKSMKAAIDDYSDKLVQRLERGSSGTDMTKDINAMEKLAEFFEDGINFAHENVIVEMEEEFRQMVAHSKSSISRSKGRPMKYEEGKIIPETLHHMIGDVKEDTADESQDSVTEVSTFTHGTEFIRSLTLISEVEAWIHSNQAKKIESVNKEGKKVDERIIDSSCDHFTVIDNSHVYTLFGDKMIRRVSSSGVITDVTSTAPLHPGGIRAARTGGLLVCLITDNISKINKDSYGEVHHLDMNGKLLRKYTDEGGDQKHLFTSPDRITQNVNLDVCVVDIIATDFTTRLVVVGVDGKKRFEYRGQPSLEESFRCKDIACDDSGKILLPDYGNNAVHLLASDGDFLQLLFTEQSTLRKPRCLDVTGGKLWIGCNKGVIKVYQYNI